MTSRPGIAYSKRMIVVDDVIVAVVHDCYYDYNAVEDEKVTDSSFVYYRYSQQ